MPIITVTSNNRTWYLIGAILTLLVGVGLAIAGFATGTTGLGIAGVVVGLAGVVFTVDGLTQ